MFWLRNKAEYFSFSHFVDVLGMVKGKSQKVTKFTFVLLMLMPETDRISKNFADKNEYLTWKPDKGFSKNFKNYYLINDIC